ncbi:hypothetical protein K438DRAFT_1782427 [Mycena galopus ATCC 62051]|nr:hypothetical protein K438DRAFT_1782427 [Mycena galopus ATCC 62051]
MASDRVLKWDVAVSRRETIGKHGVSLAENEFGRAESGVKSLNVTSSIESVTINTTMKGCSVKVIRRTFIIPVGSLHPGASRSSAKRNTRPHRQKPSQLANRRGIRQTHATVPRKSGHIQKLAEKRRQMANDEWFEQRAEAWRWANLKVAERKLRVL